MKMKVLKNINIVTPSEVYCATITICNGKIKSIERHSDTLIEDHNIFVLPGIIDSHVHFREPGLNHKENIISASMAAIAGGVTSVIDMPNTIPPLDNSSLLNEKEMLFNNKSKVDFAFHFMGTEKNLNEIQKLKSNSIASVKIFLAGHHTANNIIYNDEILYKLMSILSEKGILLTVHAEEQSLILPEYESNIDSYTMGRSSLVAQAAISRVIKICELTDCKVHFLHVSSRAEVEEIKSAKQKGLPITFEAIPPHLFFNYKDMKNGEEKIKQSPPLRTEFDQSYLMDCCVRREIDCIGSDHAPHTLEEKSRIFKDIPPGMPGVQELLPVLYTTLINSNVSEKEALQTCVHYLAYKPSILFNLANKGEITIGKDSDLVFFNINKPAFQEGIFYTQNGWSSYENKGVVGSVEKVYIRGNKVYDKGDFFFENDFKAKPLTFII